MDKYEYKHISIEVPCPDPFSTSPKFYKRLNELGAEGWLVVSKFNWCDNGNGTATHSAMFVRKNFTGGI